MNTLVAGVTYLVAGDSSAAGLYHGDTRHLRPLSVDVGDVDLTPVAETGSPPATRSRRYANVGTPVNEISESVASKHATVLLNRTQVVTEGCIREEIELVNQHQRERTFAVSIGFDADFADIFEVRGLQEALDRDVAADVDGRTCTYAYEYADDRGNPTRLETAVSFDSEPDLLEPGRAEYAVSLDPRTSRTLAVEVEPGGDESTVRASAGGQVGMDGGSVHAGHGCVGTGDVEGAGGPDQPVTRADPFVADGPPETGSRAYDRAFEQAFRDVRALTTRTEHGPVPLAGAPWFVTVFGRDALLASYLLLPFAPTLAEGTLRFLADAQATDRAERTDGSPGKILHEVRNGELARTDAVPQTPYYGTVDATPLWVTLLHETWRWTGDDQLVSELWGAFEAALGHLDRAVDDVAGGNPFLYYEALGSCGVTHKVWRDSSNGVQYGDGTVAEPPLASVDVQGYLYDALRRAAELASAVAGDEDLAGGLSARADAVGAGFDEAFWMPERGFYAAALTASGDRVDSVTSSVGHCLWSGLVPSRRADEVVARLLDEELFSGWGIRTLGVDDAGYSPISYHAGGVWPHDNAFTALGLAQYDRHEAATAVATSQLDALSRCGEAGAPELFCGFDDSSPPVAYPSACRPQAWSAAAPFGFLRALLDFGPATVDDPAALRPTDVVPRGIIDDVRAFWERTDP